MLSIEKQYQHPIYYTHQDKSNGIHLSSELLLVKKVNTCICMLVVTWCAVRNNKL